MYICKYTNKLRDTSLLPPFSAFLGPFADFKFSQRFKHSRHSSHSMHFIESAQGGFLLDACKPLKHLDENSWAGRKHEVLMTLKYFTLLSVGGDNQRKKFIKAFSNCRYQPEMLMSVRLDFSNFQLTSLISQMWYKFEETGIRTYSLLLGDLQSPRMSPAKIRMGFT